MNFKNLYCVLFALSFPILLTAQAGNCVIFSTDGASFHLALDDKFQNKDANTNVKVTDIPEGDYWVTIFFTDKTRKAFKSNIRILGKKENSFQIEKDDKSWKLKQYSSVPTAQVQSVSKKQTTLTYTATGIQIQNMSTAKDIDKDMVEPSSNITRVHGTIEEIAESKRRGKFSGSSAALEEKTDLAAATPTPEAKVEEKEGTSVINKYIETDNADGTTSILEEQTTLIKQIVVRDGQRQMRTKRSVALTPTDLTCLPMEKEVFTQLKNTVQQLATEQRLAVANSGSFPYTISDPIVEEEPKVVEKEVPAVVAEPAKEKTKAELKAELKALKAQQKADKVAAKTKAKAEKMAAKAKAKAEKEAAKKK